MNIKIKHTWSYARLLAVVILSLAFATAAVTQVSAADKVTEDPVLKYCKEVAKKAKDECGTAVGQAKNVASYHCKTAKKVQPCIRGAAKGYIKKAAKGNPDAAKFKKQLDKVFDATGYDRTKPASAGKAGESDASVFGTAEEKNPCGGGADIIYTKFNFGCLGPGPDTPFGLTPLMDLLFSLLRFMSAGVGLVIVASIIYAGIQYSTSEGNPEATQASKTRIKDAFIGLLIYIFAYSLIQFLVPGGVFT